MLKMWDLERHHKLFTSSRVTKCLQLQSWDQGWELLMLMGEVAWGWDLEYSNSTPHI